LFVTIIARIWLAGPGRADFTSARLDAGVEASGPHDFAVRESAVRQHAPDRSRAFLDPPCDSVARPTLPRPPHPAPYVRDDRDTPLKWDGTAQVVDLIWGGCEAEFFRKEGWTGQISDGAVYLHASLRPGI
jgi:hypothetical protein